MPDIEVETHIRDEMVDVTGQIQRLVEQSSMQDGLVIVFVPHTTAGVTINEHADPAVAQDMLYGLDKIVAWSDPKYRHREGNTASHIKASLMGSSVTVGVAGGRLDLGTWQGIFFCEFDGPRRRRIRTTLLNA